MGYDNDNDNDNDDFRFPKNKLNEEGMGSKLSKLKIK
jgi:hypothetical protein